MFVGAHLAEPRLDTAKPFRKIGLEIDLQSHGHGIEKKSHDVLDALDLGWAIHDADAEQDI